MNYGSAMSWVAALRSGKYTQAQRKLNKGNNQMCCLGVLCDITPGVEWYESSCGGAMVARMGESEAAGKLPQTVRDYHKMQTSSGSIIGGSATDELTRQNDNGKSFEEIADFIEKNWEKL